MREVLLFRPALSRDGARGIVRIPWTERNGHVFNVRNERGTIIFYDAQVGNGDVSFYFEHAFAGRQVNNRIGLDFLRVDNLSVSRDVVFFIKKSRSS